MVKLTAPQIITPGQPIHVAYEADARVAGRVRLTAGTELVPYVLSRPGHPATEVGTAHRVRGRQGQFTLTDWGTHAAGAELVLRFEGAKAWMTVGDQPG